MKDNRIAVIVEGESYEGKVINSVRKTFFLEHDWKASYTVIALPAAQNIYMLWNRVKDDEFVDLIEIVRDSSEDAKNKLKGLSREDFSELYLFFDYDSQQTNLPKDVIPEEVLEKMLETFNNETELGKWLKQFETFSKDAAKRSQAIVFFKKSVNVINNCLETRTN